MMCICEHYVRIIKFQVNGSEHCRLAAGIMHQLTYCVAC